MHNTTAERLIDEYSSLDEVEQAKFDKRYKDLMKFRRALNSMTKAFIAAKKKERKPEED